MVGASKKRGWSMTMLEVCCVAVLLLHTTTALPAPPSSPSSRTPQAGQSNPPPITEEELHGMVEELLMEAYGDEYEPPPATKSHKSSPSSLHLADDMLPSLLGESNFIVEKNSRGKQLTPNGPFDPEIFSLTQPLSDKTDTLQQIKDAPQKKISRKAKPTQAELEKAVLLEQPDQPNILIVDRRTKTKSKKGPSLTEPLRNSRSPEAQQDNSGNTADQQAVIQSAKLLSHMLSDNNRDFRAVGGSPSRSVRRQDSASASVPQLSKSASQHQPTLIEQLRPISERNRAKSLTTTRGEPFAPNLFTSSNFQTPRNQQFTTILDVDDVDDDELELLELLGSRINQAGFSGTQSITPAIRLGTALNLGAPGSHSSPIPQPVSRQPVTSQPLATRPSIFSTDDSIVVDIAGARQANVGVPLPIFRNNQVTPVPTQINNIDLSANSQMTVGDLVRSLNGINGIQVLSLSDLTNPNSQGTSQGNAIADQIRNVVLTDNGGSSGSGSLSVGVPLPLPSSSSQPPAPVQVASEGTGRQVDNTATDNFDDFFSDPIDTGSNVGIPLSEAAGNAGVSTNNFATEDYSTDDYALDENEDYAFGSYEDDLGDLPAQPESVFRRGLSDIFFTKGQWIGTLLGGVVDIGSSVGSGFKKLFNKSSSSDESR